MIHFIGPLEKLLVDAVSCSYSTNQQIDRKKQQPSKGKVYVNKKNNIKSKNCSLSTFP